MNWRQFIRIMKIDERAAKSKYLAASKVAKSQAIKDVLEKLAYEEEVHIDVLNRFEKELSSLQAEEKKR